MQSVMMHSAFCMPLLVTREQWLFYGWCMCVATESAPKITLKKRLTHLFLAVLGLCCGTRAFSSCGEGGYSLLLLTVVHRP